MIAVTDFRIGEEIRLSLGKFGYKIISLPPSDFLEDSISSHPDMLMFFLKQNLITGEKYYRKNKSVIDEIIKETGFNLITSKKEGQGKYPLDVCFNAAAVGEYLIGNLPYLSDEILSLAYKEGLKTVNINQGYAKCSLCVVSESAVITADKAVAKTLLNNTDLDVLLIKEGFVELPPYKYGFIGGATGSDRKNVYFCGEISNHPDSQKIIEFCSFHQKNAVSLSCGTLADFGTIFLV